MKGQRLFGLILVLTLLMVFGGPTGVSVPLGARASAFQQLPVSEFRDIGSPDDFSPAENIYFEMGIVSDPPEPGGEPWWYWYHTDTETFRSSEVFYERDGEFEWLRTPENPGQYVSARALFWKHFGRFKVDATDFPDTGTLYLTIRYKDDIMGGRWDGVAVFCYNGTSYSQIGTIGGQYDHRWKTEQLPISASQRAKVNNRYVFKIGEYAYDIEGLVGHLPVDKIKLSDDTDTSEFEADADGYWPEMPETPFADIGQDNEYSPGEGPTFLWGIHTSVGWVSHGGGPTSAGTGSKDTWQSMEEARMNMYSFHGWEQDWGSRWVEYPDEASWDDPGIMVEPGLQEHLLQAEAHGLKVFPTLPAIRC